MYRVLIVEDDPQIAKINAEYLREAGFEVAGNAENAAKAMELLESTPIQLMLLEKLMEVFAGGALAVQHQDRILLQIAKGQRLVFQVKVPAAGHKYIMKAGDRLYGRTAG